MSKESVCEDAAIVAVTVAAGSGTRFGAALPKQFCELAGRPVVMHAIEAMRRGAPAARRLVVISEPMVSFWHELCRRHAFESPEVVHGGATRLESVRNAIVALSDMPESTVVAIHDGARPLLPPSVVESALARLCRHDCDGVVPVVPLTDSIRQLDGHSPAGRAVDRNLYRAVQTPQVFTLGTLRRAYEAALTSETTFTDDASVVEAIGGRLATVDGSPTNIKITNPLDLHIASVLFRC